MKLLYVTQVNLSESSGPANHVAALCRALDAVGHEVTLIAPGQADLGGVRHIRPRGLGPGPLLEAALAALVAKACVMSRPDAVQIRICPTTSLTALAAAAARVPVITEFNGPTLTLLQRAGRSAAAISLVQTAVSAAVRLSALTVAPQQAFLDHAVDHLSARTIAVLPNGADLDTVRPGPRKAARESLGIPDEQRMIAMVGRLGPELRLDLLADAHRKLPGVALLIAGDGAQRPFVDGMAMTTRPSSPVLYLGQREHADAVRVMQAADICVDMRDGWVGMKCLEYAAVGRRFVAFDTDGVDQVESLYPGLEALHLIRTRNSASVRAALQSALEAEKRLGPLPEAAVADARQQVGWQGTARGLATLVEGLQNT